MPYPHSFKTKSNSFLELIGSLLLLILGIGVTGAGLLGTFVIVFFNSVIGIFTWPDIIDMLRAVANKPPVGTWWMGALIGLIPVIGRWYVGIIVLIIVKVII